MDLSIEKSKIIYRCWYNHEMSNLNNTNITDKADFSIALIVKIKDWPNLILPSATLGCNSLLIPSNWIALYVLQSVINVSNINSFKQILLNLKNICENNVDAVLFLKDDILSGFAELKTRYFRDTIIEMKIYDEMDIS